MDRFEPLDATKWRNKDRKTHQSIVVSCEEAAIEVLAGKTSDRLITNHLRVVHEHTNGSDTCPFWVNGLPGVQPVDQDQVFDWRVEYRADYMDHHEFGGNN